MKEKEARPTAADRRSFLKGAGMTGLGLAGAAMIGSGFSTQSRSQLRRSAI